MNQDIIIGDVALVIDSKNSCDVGITGKIVNETKNMIEFECNGRKKLLKNNIIIKIKEKIIKGVDLKGRPHERLKKW